MTKKTTTNKEWCAVCSSPPGMPCTTSCEDDYVDDADVMQYDGPPRDPDFWMEVECLPADTPDTKRMTPNDFQTKATPAWLTPYEGLVIHHDLIPDEPGSTNKTPDLLPSFCVTHHPSGLSMARFLFTYLIP